ncbi:MAG: heavy metal-associated domain-containing protein [Candidatus Micrarchaeota archaeon]
MKVSLKVKGMSCASCASAVEKALKGVKGVSSASVNLLTNSVSVDYDPKTAGIAALKQAVSKAGYELA